MVRYRFSQFTLSPQRRTLLQDGREVPLIPRYFDLLLLLVERRSEAVHRREIFERVWSNVVVSESALSQAVRTIRRALGDDSREPRFIRTVSRHGYRFVFPDLIEEEEDEFASGAGITAPGIEGAIALQAAPDHGGAAVAGALREQAPPQSATHEWTGASAGGALAGITAGGIGGLILAAAPDSAAPLAIAPVLAVVGGGCGALGGAGVGAGLALAGQFAHSQRLLALTAGAALGGGVVGAAVQWLTRWALASLVGLDVHVGGGLEGVVIGAGAGLGFALVTRRAPDGSAGPRFGKRLIAALLVALCCGLAGLALALAGRPLASGTINAIANTADGSRATLAPLARLVGEPDFGPVSAAILAFGEAAMFGVGLTLGMLRRAPNSAPRAPQSRTSHELLTQR